MIQFYFGIICSFSFSLSWTNHYSLSFSFAVTAAHTPNIINQTSSCTCVSCDVVQDHESFELTLKTLQSPGRQRFNLELPQPKFCIFVALDEQLQWPDLCAQLHRLLNTDVLQTDLVYEWHNKPAYKTYHKQRLKFNLNSLHQNLKNSWMCDSHWKTAPVCGPYSFS